MIMMHILYRVVHNSSFWDGPSINYTSYGAIVYIRAWRATSLPTPDFVHTGTQMKANELQNGKCIDFKLNSCVLFVELITITDGLIQAQNIVSKCI